MLFSCEIIDSIGEYAVLIYLNIPHAYVCVCVCFVSLHAGDDNNRLDSGAT